MARRILLVVAIAYGIRDASVLQVMQRETILFLNDTFPHGHRDEALPSSKGNMRWVGGRRCCPGSSGRRYARRTNIT